MTDQTTDLCPTPETHNWGCGCPSDVAAAIASCPGRELSPSPCRCPCYGCKHHCGAHNPETVSPVVQSPVREQLLNAIDATYCQFLGFGTPEGLLAAYEASRTQTVDQAALRDRIAALFRHKPDEERLGDATPGEIANAVLAVLPATPGRAEYDALVAEADRLRRDGAALHARAEGIDKQLAALQKQVAAPVDRAAVLRDFVRELGDRLLGCCQECNACAAIARDLAAEMAESDAELRRVADETTATETAHQPRRGDQFEAWLKTQRNSFGWQGANDRRLYDTLDGILDRYRLYADTGTPLGEHVCETKAVGDCECLEQPATETCDHDSQVIDHEGAQYWACLKCGTNLGPVEPAAGPRQDGAQQ
ncbi:hypothetical protein [Streptomyces tendae]|uniref:hypothetical protein n=1 Tax=Streptomyces tendae TaxID=1932 RepID=UPI003813ED77